MKMKKAAKVPAQGQLSAEIIEDICGRLASLVEQDLRYNHSWVRWTQSAANTWMETQERCVAGDVAAKTALREAATCAKDAAVLAARDWATAWFSDKGELLLKFLPTQEEYAERARFVAENAVGPNGTAAEEPVSEEELRAGNSEAWTKLLAEMAHTAAEKALQKKRELDTASSERFSDARSPYEAHRQTWHTAFSADAARSIHHVRAVIASVALKVVQQTAFERARAVADTMSRRLAMDLACGRLQESMGEIRACEHLGDSGMTAVSDPEKTGGFWREISVDAARVLSRSDVRRLVNMPA